MTVAVTARVARGLEWVAADEIGALPTARQVTLGRREVRFIVPALDPAVGTLRTVDDVFVHAGALEGVGRDRRTPAVVGAAVSRLDLAGAVESVRAVRGLPHHPGLDVVASLDGDRRFNRYDLEDAVGTAVSPVLGGHYGSRREGPLPPGDLTLRVVVTGESAQVMVRIGLRPLHRRPWKHDTAPATLHPPAAAALVRLVGSRTWVVDPFCGDGTIPIEAGLAHRAVRAVGSDLDGRRLANARSNAARAGLTLSWVKADAAWGPWRPGPDGAWVTNPPWNRAAARRGGVAATLAPAWADGRRILGPTGALAAIVDAGIDLSADLGPAGWRPVLVQQARLAGRVCRLVVAVPVDGPGPDPVSTTLRSWRRRAADEGLVTGSTF
jgi:23S rRNA G2445 N2-methylase RlmL